MRWRSPHALAGAIAVTAIGLLPVVVALASGAGGTGFPHREHATLFPSCLGCHAGVPSDDSTAFYSISPGDCATCHDGRLEKSVDWSGPTRTPTNVAFSHRAHSSQLAARGEPALQCESCHQVPGATERMDVAAADPGSCLSCHAHRAPAHLAEGTPCTTCHVPLASATALTSEQIATFREPEDHRARDFALTHGDVTMAGTTRCAVCHARESCQRCHLNAESVEQITALHADARVKTMLAGVAGEWPIPPSHRRADWGTGHGADAMESIQSCANCHAAASCTACHGSAGAGVAADLPHPSPEEPQGVVLADARPAGHTPDFLVSHGATASTDLPSCGSCHRASYCATCHDGPARSAFHPQNFVVRHAAEAYSEQATCSECHSRPGFCRDCHTELGVGVSRASGNGYHDAQPDWLLNHGQAARQGMEECATCHQQTSCLRCHSAKAGWRVNPHGPGFDPNRVGNKSLQSCAVCHFAGQIGRP